MRTRAREREYTAHTQQIDELVYKLVDLGSYPGLAARSLLHTRRPLMEAEVGEGSGLVRDFSQVWGLDSLAKGEGLASGFYQATGE